MSLIEEIIEYGKDIFQILMVFLTTIAVGVKIRNARGGIYNHIEEIFILLRQFRGFRGRRAN